MANIIRFNDPFAGLTSMHSQLDDLFSSVLSTPGGAAHSLPAMDIYTEDDNRLVTEIAAPGFAKDDVSVSVHNGVLEIRGQKTDKHEDGKQGKRSYMVRENHASFYRSIVLPKYADTDNIAADFEDGVLKVTVPFKELPQPRKVQIGSGKKESGTAKK